MILLRGEEDCLDLNKINLTKNKSFLLPTVLEPTLTAKNRSERLSPYAILIEFLYRENRCTVDTH